MKSRVKELGLKDIRINKSGCLERCEMGPSMVIYPEGIWYTYQSTDDVDEIIDRHIMGGGRVDRLMMAPGQISPEPEVRPVLELKVTAIEAMTPEIKRLELSAVDGGELPKFEAGAHVEITTDAGLRRSYSLANGPKERRRYVLAVLREVDAQGLSTWMHDRVSVGDILEAAPPLNNFRLAPGADEHIMIAGGIGITPLLSMGYRLRHLGARRTLHYCTKSPGQTAFTDEVKEVFGDRLFFHFDGGDPAKGIKLDQVLGKRPPGAHLYVCGPSGLMDAVRQAAARWPEDTVHFELFQPRASPKQWTNESFEISLSRRKTVLSVPKDKTILQVIRESGVDGYSSCENGLCGTCRIRLLGGRAEHRDEVLTKAEKEENSAIMICVSRARKGELLVLDL
jgi:vanillate O-demethylase ferredoxin subunit